MSLTAYDPNGVTKLLNGLHDICKSTAALRVLHELRRGSLGRANPTSSGSSSIASQALARHAQLNRHGYFQVPPSYWVLMPTSHVIACLPFRCVSDAHSCCCSLLPSPAVALCASDVVPRHCCPPRLAITGRRARPISRCPRRTGS